ncbi:MAG TPA: MarP family serine protease [Acidimicrobiia bacterium]|nr:MarP family serine protease [Acidimicrobiia bacterium]
MNLLDLFIILTAGAAAYGGYRLGFVARIFSWAGLVIGALVADRFLPDVVAFFSASDPQIRLIAAISFLVGASMLGQGVGLAVGSLLHAALPLGTGLRQSDRVAGSALGIVGVLAGVWLLIPALAAVPGWPAEATRGSAIAHMVEDVAPAAPETMQALRRFVQDGTFPAVFNELRRSPDPGPPPTAGLDEAIHQRVLQSTVKVTGEACRRIQEGSGFVAMPGIVVTNAHVVAGEKAPKVEPYRGKQLPATVILFDANRDLALLRVPGLAEQPLPIRPDTAKEGETGAVYGHPGGGPLRPAPAKISQELIAVGRDIYDRNDTRRHIFVLASALRPGDSGAALVDKSGRVAGVAFAIAPDKPGVSYALTDKELKPVLARAGTTPVSTGGCLDT